MSKPIPERTYIDIGLQYGLIKPDWLLEQYLVDASTREDGYETVAVQGVQGSGKSSQAMQMVSWIKENELHEKLGRNPTEKELWESVLDCIIFKPSDFVRTLEAVPDGEPLSVLLWDDISVHYTSSTYKTDADQYAAIDACWAAVRTKCRVIILTIPNLTRLAKNVKDNISFQVFIGRNRLEQVRRVFRLPGTKAIDSNVFFPIIGKPFKFDLYKVPLWAWNRYYAKRVQLANEALATLKGVTNMEDVEGYVTILDAVRLCREHNVGWRASTIQQHVSRGVLKGQKLNGVLCVDRDHLLEYLAVENPDPP